MLKLKLIKAFSTFSLLNLKPANETGLSLTIFVISAYTGVRSAFTPGLITAYANMKPVILFKKTSKKSSSSRF